MTDKELFEKTEKTLNLKRKNKTIVEFYKKSEFKKILERKTRTTNTSNTSPVKSNYTQNTTSAAATAGKGALNAAELAGKGIGAAAKGVGKVGGFLRGIIPGTNANKRKKAETQKREAETKAAQLKNKQLQQQMMFGGGQSTPGGKTAPGGPTAPGGSAEAEKIRIQADQYNINILTRNGNNFKKTPELRKKIAAAIENNVQPGKAKTHKEFRDTYASAYGAVNNNIDQSQNTTVSDGSTLNVGGDLKSANTASPTSTVTPNANNAPKVSSSATGGSGNNADLKIGDIVRYKNTKGKESQGAITNLNDPNKPGNIIIKAKNGQKGSLNQNKIFGKVNESYQYSFEQIVKRYR